MDSMVKTKTALILFCALSVAMPLVSAHAQSGSAKPPVASHAASVPTKPAVLAAVARMMRVVGEGGAAIQIPSGAADKKWADDMKIVAHFAQDSPDVTITIDPRFYDADAKGAGPILLAYYLAGAVRYDLQHPGKATDPYADQAAAVHTELLAYRYAQKRAPKLSLPLLDKLQKLEMAGKLNAYVADAAKAPPAKK